MMSEIDRHYQHNLKSIFWTKSSYDHFAATFHPYHKHDLNALVHVFTTGLGVWGAIQMVLVATNTAQLAMAIVLFYAGVIAVTTPVLTAAIHTVFVIGCLQFPIREVSEFLQLPVEGLGDLGTCALAIIAGYGLQDLIHWLCVEKTLMSTYIHTSPSTLIVHSIWLMPLVIDSILIRHCFVPKLFVSRNRTLFCQVASKKAVQTLREWINNEVSETPETTHLWPHKQEGTDGPVTQLENDASILAAFRVLFAPYHFDIRPVVEMNEIYVTAVGANQEEITSDAVFYTPHTDGPFWWLPGASLYRVLVGVTPNTMVRTKFNLQHPSENKTVDMHDTLGFDYNRELHLIDHVPGETNTERRSLIKLHFIVYPKCWHRYGKFCAYLNYSYNTWARQNFLRTLRPDTLTSRFNAWWIFATTWTNAMFEMHIGWSNLTYVLATYLLLGETTFLVLTSFRHYCVYIATFAYRSPPVAHGVLMRDCKFYKTLALMHLSKRIVPLVELPKDIPCIIAALAGFSITILATLQLGMLRTYFGSELGFVKPSWIRGFPYNTIPHPMIVGQLVGFSCILYWFQDIMPVETVALLVAHMSFYSLHMVQEILTSSY